MALAQLACGAPQRSGARRCIVRCVFLAAVVFVIDFIHREAHAANQNQADGAPAKAGGHAAEDAPKLEEQGAATQPGQGHLIRVTLPITDDVDTRVRRAVTQLLGNLKPGGPRPALIIELWPGRAEGGAGSDFYRAKPLADFLASRDLADRMKTVAYIPKTIKGHAVLVAMACEEIIMAPDAEIGDAGIDERVLSPTVRHGYAEIAEARSTIPVAMALAMLDRNVTALKVATEIGAVYVLPDQLEALRKNRVVQEEAELKPRPLLVDGRRARHELGVVSYLAEDRSDVARALKLSAASLQDNPMLAGDPRPVQVNLKGEVNATKVNRIQKLIQDQIRNNDVNLVVLYIDSEGGSFAHSLQLASFLSQLDPSRVRTVAYVPRLARADSALVAAACDQLVVHADAKLGGEGVDVLKPDAAELVVSALRETLKKNKSRSWSLPAAMANPELKVFRYTNPNNGLTSYFSEEEVREQRDPAAWKQGDLVTGGGPLQLSGQKAEAYGLAWKVVDGPEQLQQAYGLKEAPSVLAPGWADHLIDALSSDGARMFLIILLIVGVYLEVHTPGVGVGGFVALLAAVLYFWAQHLQGNPVVLEVLLFLAGVLCLALEIFVIPGFGVFGFGGGLLIIASLVLASQTFVIPTNTYQWEKLRNSLLVLGGAVAGSVLAGAVMRRFLPHTPMLNRMLLAPPSGAELEALSHRESFIELEHLLGTQGVATTPLILSGKARFGDQLVDVIAEGDAIDRGTMVTVIDVSGSRVVVRPTQSA